MHNKQGGSDIGMMTWLYVTLTAIMVMVLIKDVVKGRVKDHDAIKVHQEQR